jgi:hypothetical protein
MLDGKVIGTCTPRHRHREFLRFLRLIEWTRSAGEILEKVGQARQELESQD